MRCITTLAFCLFTLLISCAACLAAGEVAAQPDVIEPGQAVTLRWYFTGTKVVVSGGRFGTGAVVTGHTSLVDHPRKTTRYTFNVWYRGLAPTPGADTQTMKPLHAKYDVVVEVIAPLPPLTAYSDPHGWQVHYVGGWKRDNVSTPDEGSDGLTFFQKEEDSVERLVVAVMPVKEMTCGDLMDKIRADMPSHYSEVAVVSQEEVTYENVPAKRAIFTGIDQSHPGTRTQSLVLAFVREGKAYIVSTRTSAGQFRLKRPLLEKMLRSFSFTKKVSRIDI